MASLPLAQPVDIKPVDLGRFSVHYSMSSESHDRGHSSANHTQTHTPVHHHHHHPHHPHRQSPTSSSARDHASPRGGFDSPSSLPTSAPSHQTSFGLDQSDSTLPSDGGSLAHSSPALPTWATEPKPQSQSMSQAFSQSQSQSQSQSPLHSQSQQPQMQPSQPRDGMGFGPAFPSYNAAPPQYRSDMSVDTYPRAAPYYMSIGPMHAMDSQRDLVYERKRAEEQMRREREIAKSRRHVCPVCEKRFNRPSSLNTHMSVHTGAKPYQCTREGCGRRFSVSSNLRRHERTHEARARPVPKQQPTTPHATATVSYSSPAQPTVFLQAGPHPPPANISYPYTYHSASPHTHATHPSTHGLNSSSAGFPITQRYAYHLGGSMGGGGGASSTRDYHYPSLIHHRDTAGLMSNATGASNGSSNGNGNGSVNGAGNSNGGGGGGGARSQSATPPAQQNILMPQPTKPNTLML